MGHSLLLIAMLLIQPAAALAQVIDLRGQWKFHIDDKPEWARANFDDAKWESIFTPSAWEDEGFHGYDGFAWYRKTFDGKLLNRNDIYYIGLGFIDDCDEVYVNGKLVGFSGSMPPKFKTSYNTERKYPLPSELINYNGNNTVAIRVFDATLGGGIIGGRLGIYRNTDKPYIGVDLRGVWSFSPVRGEDSPTTDASWRNIMVPGAWEYQGFLKYDGFARYRRTFTVPPQLMKESLVLLMGWIDDFDKTYINGKLVGSTNDGRRYGESQSYQQQRVYEIPPGLLIGGINTIDVVVEDMGNYGGIWGGVVGIATKENYRRYVR